MEANAMDQDSSSTRQPLPVSEVICSIVRDRAFNLPYNAEAVEARRKADEEADKRRAMAEQEANFSRLLRDAGQRAKEFRFANYITDGEPYKERCKQKVLAWSESGADGLKHTRNLVLYGPVGSGKDHLAIAACRTLCLKHGLTVGFLSVQDWFGKVRDAMDDNSRERDLIYDANNCKVLVLSDPTPPFGNLTQHQATMLYRLVADRANSMKSTIVTANVANDSEAYDRIGAPTWNRLLEDSLMIYCNWSSFRKPREIVTNVKPNK